MTIIRTVHNKDNPYTVINSEISKDKRLSWKAKGILLYAFSRPDDWQFYLSDLVNQSTDGKDSVKAGLKELEMAGYLEREQTREKGKFAKVEWILYERPQEVELKNKVPKEVKLKNKVSRVENSFTMNPLLLINEAKQVLKENNNVVVSPSLDKLDISQSLKVKLTKKYSEQQIEEAIKALEQIEVMNWTKAIQAALRDGYKANDKKDRSEENRKKILDMAGDSKAFHLQNGKKYTITAFNEYVEIRYLNSVQYFKYNEANFKDKVNAHIEKIRGAAR